MFIKQNKGQSILEYAIMLGVVIAAVLIMQTFVKRGFQGSLKNSAEKMGEQFSAGGTTTKEETKMTGNDQIITTEVATDGKINAFLPSTIDTGEITGNTLASGVYSATKRAGGTMSADSKTATDSVALEKTRWSEYQTDEASVDEAGNL